MEISTVKTLIPAPQDGDKGDDAVQYYMVSETMSINVKDGESSTEDFTVRGYRRTGSGQPERYDADIVVTYVCEGSDNWTDDDVSLPFTLQPSRMYQFYEDGLSRINIKMLDNRDNVVYVLDIPVVRDGADGKDGRDGVDGKDGTSFTIQGRVAGIFNSQEEMRQAETYIGGIYLVQPDSIMLHLKNASDGQGGMVKVLNEITGPSVNDAYITNSDNHLYVFNGTRYQDLGEFKGEKGERGEKGEKGDKGDRGERGLSGPMSYMAGAWDNKTTYTRTSDACPVVLHGGYYWKPKHEGSNLGGEPSAESAFWTIVDHFQMIITELLMAEFGKIASAIFSGSYMFSQFGKLNGQAVNENSEKKDTAYLQFDATNPDNTAGFVPNLFINFLTGRMKALNAEIEGIVRASGGNIGGFDIHNGCLGIGNNISFGTNGTPREQWKGGMTLKEYLISFAQQKRYASLGQQSLDGMNLSQMIQDTEATDNSKYGTFFNVQNATGQNFAFAGYGVATLNGFIQGYGMMHMYLYRQDSVHDTVHNGILDGDRVFVHVSVADQVLMLPKLSVMLRTLGLKENQRFSFQLTYVSVFGNSDYRIYGRNSDKAGCNTTEYPVFVSMNGGDYKYKSHGKGDVLQLMLNYDPNEARTIDSKDCKYTAYIINISE